MKRTHMETEWGPFVDDIAGRAPIAMLWAPELKNTGKSNGPFFAPPDMLRQRNVRAWRLHLSEPAWKKPSAVIKLVERAEPVR